MTRTSSLLALVLILFLSSLSSASADVVSDRVKFDFRVSGEVELSQLAIIEDFSGGNFSTPPSASVKTFKSVLAPCQSQEQQECIESLMYRKAGTSRWSQGLLSRIELPNMNGIEAYRVADTDAKVYFGVTDRDESRKIPLGTQTSLWNLEGAKHTGGDGYLLTVSISDALDVILQNQYSMRIHLRPVSIKLDQQNRAFDRIDNISVPFNFPPDFEFKVVIKLGFLESKLSNWYSGRIRDVKVKKDSGILEIEGQPSQVPIAATLPFSCSVLDQKRLESLNSAFGRNALESPFCTRSIRSTLLIRVVDSHALGTFSAFEDDFQELGKNSEWNLQSVSELGDCQKDGVSGVVTSNALLYTLDPPKYNKTDRSLTYQLASTHLDSKGLVNRGRFNLTIRDDVAECLWGIKPSLISSASIRVTYIDGTPISGTHSVSSRSGWTFVNIEDFSFSSPTFRIAPSKFFQQGASPNQASTQTATSGGISLSAGASLPASKVRKPSVIGKSTVTCLKGKKAKRTTAQKPSCPRGYKKK